MAGGFERNTRQKMIRLASLSRPVGGGITSIELPKTGLLARIYLNITGAVSGTLSAPNALGMASIIKRVRLATNSGIDIFNVSGAGFAYMLNQAIETGLQPAQPSTAAFVAVTATTYTLNFVIPVMLNLHDPVGLILLQNEQLQTILTVEWEADATVATGATVTGTAAVMVEFFTVPVDPADMPPLNLVHQTIEDQIGITASGDYIYNAPRGATYLQILAGIADTSATFTDSGWTRFILRINQSDILYDFVPGAASQWYELQKGRTRPTGTIFLDWLGSDGLGNYGSARDFINSALLTDMQAVITLVSPTKLYVIRRMLLPLV